MTEPEIRSTCTACGSVLGDDASNEPCQMTGAAHRYVPDGECPECVWEGDRNVQPCAKCSADNQRTIAAWAGRDAPRVEAVAAPRQPRQPRDMIVAMVGTRRRIPSVLDDITTTLEDMNRDILVVTGDAGGVDAHVKRMCKRFGFRLIVCHARCKNGEWAGDWAGPERNEVVARLAQRVIAWPGSSRDTPLERKQSAGTWDCVERFERRSKPVDIREMGWRVV